MAHSLSAKKRIRQNAKQRSRNRIGKRQLKNSVHSFEEVLDGGDQGKSTEALRAAIKKIDQTAARGIIHKNTASRKKSQLQRKLNAATKA